MDLPTFLNVTRHTLYQSQSGDPLFYTAAIFLGGFFLGILIKWGGKLIFKIFLIAVLLGLIAFLLISGVLGGITGLMAVLIVFALYIVKKLLI